MKKPILLAEYNKRVHKRLLARERAARCRSKKQPAKPTSNLPPRHCGRLPQPMDYEELAYGIKRLVDMFPEIFNAAWVTRKPGSRITLTA